MIKVKLIDKAIYFNSSLSNQQLNSISNYWMELSIADKYEFLIYQLKNGNLSVKLSNESLCKLSTIFWYGINDINICFLLQRTIKNFKKIEDMLLDQRKEMEKAVETYNKLMKDNNKYEKAIEIMIKLIEQIEYN